MRIGQNLTGTGSQANGTGVNDLRAGRARVRRGIAVGRDRARRRADGFDSQGRRQPVLRRLSILLLERRRCRTTTSPTTCGSSSAKATSCARRGTTTWRSAARSSRTASGSSPRSASSQNDSYVADSPIPGPGGRTMRLPNGDRVNRDSRIAPNGQLRLTGAADEPRQAARRVLQLERPDAALRRRVHGDERQPRVLRRA